jgi:hypothetical protein
MSRDDEEIRRRLLRAARRQDQAAGCAVWLWGTVLALMVLGGVLMLWVLIAVLRG